jgi:formate hydrogenlyase transcriptional activator
MGENIDESPSTAAVKLRRDAEKQLSAKKSGLRLTQSKLEAERVLHEFEVHQIELEMQNESLRTTQDDLEQSRNTYAELYDYAPVGYFTFDIHGVIRDVNFAGAQMLGTEKRLLVNKPFFAFIADASEREIFFNHLALTLKRRVMLRCEIKFVEKNGSVIYGHLQSVAVNIGKKGGYILTSIVDGTVRRQLEEKLQKSHNNLETLVGERTQELTRSNMQLTHEIEERKAAEVSLKGAYAEIKRLKDRLQAENIFLQKEVDRHFNFGEIIGKSPLLSQVFLRVEQVAPMNATVLLLGETGTGKGVVARAIHGRSARKDRPMMTVNCTTLPASLVESELFGRERGAFTGSDARQIGRFELADGCTIFLDEIGEMPMELQSKLLRVIQDGEFERLGSPRTIKIDVRIIAATNRNLEEEIRNGRFREDLYYRLNVFPITMPPLRLRKDDIPMLVSHFVAKFNKKIGKTIESVSKETLKAFRNTTGPAMCGNWKASSSER